MEKRGLSLYPIGKIRSNMEKGVTDGWLVNEINEEAQNRAGTFDPTANLTLCQDLNARGFKGASALLKRLVLGEEEKMPTAAQQCHLHPCTILPKGY